MLTHQRLPAVTWCCRWWCKERRGKTVQEDFTKIFLNSPWQLPCACVRSHAHAVSIQPQLGVCRSHPLVSLGFFQVCSGKLFWVGSAAGFFSVPLFDTCATNKKTCKSLFISFSFTGQRKELAENVKSSNESRLQSVPHICQETVGQGKRTR